MHPGDPLGRGSSSLGGRRRHWARPPGMAARLSAPARRRGGRRGALGPARPGRCEDRLRHGRGRRGAAGAGRPVPDRKPGSRSCAGGLGPRLPFRPRPRSARWRRPLRCARSGAEQGGAELPSLSGPAAAAARRACHVGQRRRRCALFSATCPGAGARPGHGAAAGARTTPGSPAGGGTAGRRRRRFLRFSVAARRVRSRCGSPRAEGQATATRHGEGSGPGAPSGRAGAAHCHLPG